MTFLWPWSLLGLAAVVAAALWALYRPARRLLVVASLSLWQRALDALDRSSRRRSRRVTASWALLLAGAAAGALAAARPVFYVRRPARAIAIAICPSLEIASTRRLDVLRDTLEAFLARLGPADRVQLLLPMAAGGDRGWLSRGQALGQIDSAIRTVPIPADECVFPEASADAQHLYRFLPAGAKASTGPHASVIELPTAVAPVTVDALAAAEVGDRKVQLFVAARNHLETSRTVKVVAEAVQPGGAASGAAARYATEAATIEPNGRREFVLLCGFAEAFRVRLVGKPQDPAGLGVSGCILASPAAVRKVAVIGPHQDSLSRFVSAHPGLAMVAEPAEADVLICNAADPPPNKPALVIDPPTSPAGWRRGASVGPLLLADVDVRPDEPVMQHVDLAAVAVRQVRPWVAAEAASQTVLASYKRDAIMLRNAPAELPEADRPAGRIYVAFDLDEENTNFSVTHAFVIFLANAIDWLSPGESSGRAFEYLSPSQALALGQGSWEYLSDELSDSAWRSVSGFVGPGFYRSVDPQARPIAVGLAGLRRAEPGRPPAEAVAALPLPETRPVQQPVEFWPGLVVAAVISWLSGWALRAR